jgi:GNAT superfamily N-acetyltransferase
MITFAEITEASGKQVAGFALWDPPGDAAPSFNLEPVPMPNMNCERKDGNLQRMKAYVEAIRATRKALFTDVYGERHLSLRELAVSPAYWRQGIGSRLLLSGLDIARTRNVPVTLFGSPLGRPMYLKYGFEEIGIMHVKVDGDDAILERPAMVWHPRDDST